MRKLCQFCSYEVDGCIRFNQNWICWDCLDNYGLQNASMTVFYKDNVPHPPYRPRFNVVIELLEDL